MEKSEILEKFKDICRDGDLEKVKNFCEKHEIPEAEVWYSSTECQDYRQLLNILEISISSGHPEVTKWLISKFGYPSEEAIKTAFTQACHYSLSGKDMAQRFNLFLDIFGALKMRKGAEYQFTRSLVFGNTELTQRLWEEYGFTFDDINMGQSWESIVRNKKSKEWLQGRLKLEDEVFSLSDEQYKKYCKNLKKEGWSKWKALEMAFEIDRTTVSIENCDSCGKTLEHETGFLREDMAYSFGRYETEYYGYEQPEIIHDLKNPAWKRFKIFCYRCHTLRPRTRWCWECGEKFETGYLLHKHLEETGHKLTFTVRVQACSYRFNPYHGGIPIL